MSIKPSFVFDIWYFAGLSSDVKRGKMVRRPSTRRVFRSQHAKPPWMMI